MVLVKKHKIQSKYWLNLSLIYLLRI